MFNFKMKHAVRGALLAPLLGISIAGGALNAFAGAGDYQFKLVQNEVKKADSAIVAVQLIDTRTNTPVSDAVVFATRLDMAPDDMVAMTSTVKLLPSTEPGIYRFDVNLTATGGWRLTLGAKVQGEADTVTGKLDFKVKP